MGEQQGIMENTGKEDGRKQTLDSHENMKGGLGENNQRIIERKQEGIMVENNPGIPMKA